MEKYEILQAFHDEIKEKKQTATGASAKRLKSKSAGRWKPLRTPYLYMSRQERKSLNSGVIAMNMNELVPRDDLLQFDVSTQKQVLNNWMEKYSVSEICQGLGVRRRTLYNLLNELGLETKMPKPQGLILSEIKREIPYTYEEFKELSVENRLKYLLPLNKYSLNDLAKYWNTNIKNVSNFRTRLKAHLQKMSEENATVPQQAQQPEIPQTPEQPEVPFYQAPPEESKQAETEVSPEEEEEEEPKQPELPVATENKETVVVAEMVNDFFFQLNKKGSNQFVIKKLKMLISFLEDDEDSEYDINLTVRG